MIFGGVLGGTGVPQGTLTKGAVALISKFWSGWSNARGERIPNENKKQILLAASNALRD
jgi:hypothetical protein